MRTTFLCTIVADLGWVILGMTDGPWTVLGLMVTTFGGIALAWIQLKSLSASKAAVKKGEEAVVKVGMVHDEVKTVKEEIKEVKVDTVKSVKMLNGATLAIQKQLAIATASVARDHPDDKGAASAAIEAEKNYRDHLAAAAAIEADELTKAKVATTQP